MPHCGFLNTFSHVTNLPSYFLACGTRFHNVYDTDDITVGLHLWLFPLVLPEGHGDNGQVLPLLQQHLHLFYLQIPP